MEQNFDGHLLQLLVICYYCYYYSYWWQAKYVLLGYSGDTTKLSSKQRRKTFIKGKENRCLESKGNPSGKDELLRSV